MFIRWRHNRRSAAMELNDPEQADHEQTSFALFERYAGDELRVILSRARRRR